MQEHEKQIARIQVSCQRQVQRPPVHRVRPTILVSGSMKKAAAREVTDLISQLRIQFDKVREKTEFLKLKQSELRPDDWMSQTMFRDAQDELAMEQSILIGHATMVREIIIEKKVTVDPGAKRFLAEITRQTYGSDLCASYQP